jgi:hypothetical protein
MTDKQLPPVVRAWLKGTDVEPEDVHRSASHASARVERTRQRGRWWPLPSPQRSPDRPTPDPTQASQPTPVAPASGHSPTLTGRTFAMITPVKAISAGAFVFAIGSMFLITQPFDQEGNGIQGAAIDGERQAPVEFTGRLLHGQLTQDGSSETVSGVIEERGAVFSPVVLDMSDSRLAGTVTVAPDANIYGGEDGVAIMNKTFRIENEGGAWQEVPGLVLTFPDGSTSNWTSAFTGEGEYAGLVAIADVVHDPIGGTWDLHGFIVDGDLPTGPAAASSE